MPKRGLIAFVFTMAGLRMILGYTLPARAGIGAASPSPTGTPDPGASPTPTPTPTPSGSARDGSFSGSNFNYNYGVMKVTIKVSGGKITDASVSQNGQWPIGYRRGACTESVFNSAAVDLAVAASTGSDFMAKQPNACSGATYSWWGYANSLQAAIDKAGY